MDWGEAGIRASLKARRARARKPDSPDEAARNSLEEHIALRDAENALKAPDRLIAAAGEAIRPEFRLDFLIDRLKDEPDMIDLCSPFGIRTMESVSGSWVRKALHRCLTQFLWGADE